MEPPHLQAVVVLASLALEPLVVLQGRTMAALQEAQVPPSKVVVLGAERQIRPRLAQDKMRHAALGVEAQAASNQPFPPTIMAALVAHLATFRVVLVALLVGHSMALMVFPVSACNRVLAVEEARLTALPQKLAMVAQAVRRVAVAVAEALALTALQMAAMVVLVGAEKSGLFHMLLIRGHNAN